MSRKGVNAFKHKSLINTLCRRLFHGLLGTHQISDRMGHLPSTSITAGEKKREILLYRFICDVASWWHVQKEQSHPHLAGHIHSLLSYEMGLVSIPFTAISAGTERTKLIATRWALCDDSYRRIQDPLLKTTKMAAELSITSKNSRF